MRKSHNRKNAFTLIELLVVITIIALLVSILMPSLSKAKMQARRVLCANNLKGQTTGILIYASQHNGKLPTTGGSWFWDMTFKTTDTISKMAGFQDNEIYFCPECKYKKPTDARWWQFTMCQSAGLTNVGAVPLFDEDSLTSAQKESFIRVMSFVYTFDRVLANGQKFSDITDYQTYYPRTNTNNTRNNYWLKNVDKVKHTSEKQLACDVVMCQADGTKITCYDNDWKFFGLTQTYAEADYTNHKGRKRLTNGPNSGPAPDGGVNAFVDGHASWKKFEDMDMRVQANGFHWWW